jgi:hypothetical protein
MLAAEPFPFDHRDTRRRHVHSGIAPDLRVNCSICGSRMLAERFSRCALRGSGNRWVLVLRCPTCRNTGVLNYTFRPMLVGADVAAVVSEGLAGFVAVTCPEHSTVRGYVDIYGHRVEGAELELLCGFGVLCEHRYTLRVPVNDWFSDAPHAHPAV